MLRDPTRGVAREGRSTPREPAEYFSGRPVGYAPEVRRRGGCSPPYRCPDQSGPPSWIARVRPAAPASATVTPAGSTHSGAASAGPRPRRQERTQKPVSAAAPRAAISSILQIPRCGSTSAQKLRTAGTGNSSKNPAATATSRPIPGVDAGGPPARPDQPDLRPWAWGGQTPVAHADRRLFARPPPKYRPRSAIGVGLGSAGALPAARTREAAHAHQLEPRVRALCGVESPQRSWPGIPLRDRRARSAPEPQHNPARTEGRPPSTTSERMDVDAAAISWRLLHRDSPSHVAESAARAAAARIGPCACSGWS